MQALLLAPGSYAPFRIKVQNGRIESIEIYGLQVPLSEALFEIVLLNQLDPSEKLELCWKQAWCETDALVLRRKDLEASILTFTHWNCPGEFQNGQLMVCFCVGGGVKQKLLSIAGHQCNLAQIRNTSDVISNEKSLDLANPMHYDLIQSVLDRRGDPAYRACAEYIRSNRGF